MALGILTNVAATYAENNLNQTQNSLQTVLQQLSSGSRINSGADDAAGLSVADGLHANEAALTQSAQNAKNGVGLLQTADGALSQVTNLLDRAVTLATEASNGGLTTAQSSCGRYGVSEHCDRDRKHRQLDELQQHGRVLGNRDGFRRQRRNNGRDYDDRGYGWCAYQCERRYRNRRRSWNRSLGAGADQPDCCPDCVEQHHDAIADVANQRGAIGANINQLNAAANVASSEEVNLSSAESNIRSTNYGQATSDLAKYQVLSQTGISALAQANSVQQEILKLLQ